VTAELQAVHAAQISGWGTPGTWGTGAQRLAVAAEARKAGIEAGLLEAPGGSGVAPALDLPEMVKRVVRRLAVSPTELDHAFYEQALNDGLSDCEYVEIVGLVARITNIDIFARGIGVDLPPFPAAEPGAPSAVRPAVAVQELAWAPTVPNPPEGGEIADELYRGHAMPYIIRAMSLVPDEVRLHLALEEVQYLPLHRIMEYDYAHHDGLSRAQAEVVAGRISALNDCFY
jgi:hypothetical protein